jgi:probable phosphoglycerate mutase
MIEDWEERLCAYAKSANFDPGCARFFFLRHGQTEHNRRRICQGHTDVPLNDIGLTQADRAAAVLIKAQPSSLTTSDLTRVRQTAKPIADKLALKPAIDARLRERSFGIYEDRPIEGHLWSFDHPSIETIEAFVDRSLEGFAAALNEDDTLVVTHGGLRRVLAGALDIDMPYWSGHNAVPLRFSREGSGWRVEAMTEAGIWPIDGAEPSDLDR